MPEAEFTFQITFPNGGFWGVAMKPWDQRDRTVFEIMPEVQGKVAAIPGIQTFPILVNPRTFAAKSSVRAVARLAHSPSDFRLALWRALAT